MTYYQVYLEEMLLFQRPVKSTPESTESFSAMEPLRLLFLLPGFPPGQLLFHPSQPSSNAITSRKQGLFPSFSSFLLCAFLPTALSCVPGVGVASELADLERLQGQSGRARGGLRVLASGRSLAQRGAWASSCSCGFRGCRGVKELALEAPPADAPTGLGKPPRRLHPPVPLRSPGSHRSCSFGEEFLGVSLV